MKVSKMLTVFSMIIFLTTVGFSKSNNPVKYISKYNTSDNKNIVVCNYDYKNNILIYKLGGKIIKSIQYDSLNDFIQERENFGLSLGKSEKIDQEKYKDNWAYSYDSQKRLIKEKGDNITIEWGKWDSKKRNIAGIMEMFGIKDIKIVVEYNEKLRLETSKYTYPEGLLEKCPSLPIETIQKFDEYHNEVLTKNKLANGESSEEIINIIEYATVSGK